MIDSNESSSLKQQIAQAARRITSGNPESRQRGLEELRRIEDDHYGTPIGELAWKILHEDLVRRGRRGVSADEDRRRKERLEAGVRGIHDLRSKSLQGMLDELFHQGLLDADWVEQLQKDAIAILSKLLRAAAADGGPLDDRLVGRLAATIHAHPGFSSALAPTLDEVERIQGERRLEIARAGVESALEIGDLVAARTALHEVGGLPESLAPTRDALGERVAALAARLDSIDECIARLSAFCQHEPRDWEGVRSAAEALEGLHGLAAPGRLAPERQGEIATIDSETHALLARTIEQAARGCASATQAADFQATLDRLPEVWWDLVQDTWFDELRQAMHTTLLDAVAAAPDVDALDEVRQIHLDSTGLPAALAQGMSELDERIRHLAGHWRALSSGETAADAELKLAALTSLPSAYCELRQRVCALEELIDGYDRELASAVTSADLESVLVQLRSQAEAWPEHSGLRRRITDTEGRLWRVRCDEALAGWRVDVLDALLGVPLVDAELTVYATPYLRLKGHLGALKGLAAAAALPPAESTEEALAWWRNWDRDTELLKQGGLPPALGRAVAEESRRRAARWVDLLESMLTDPSVSAQSLSWAAEELTEPALSYGEVRFCQQRLRQYALEQEAESALAGGDLSRAEELLDRLEGFSTGRRRLRGWRIRIDAGRAAASGLLAEAEYWAKMLPEIVEEMGSDASTRLLILLEGCLREVLIDTLPPLCRRIETALGTGQLEGVSPDRLNRLLAWVRVDEALRTSFGPESVRAFCSHYFAQDETDRSLGDLSLESIVTHWRSAGDLVALAWADWAFPEHREALFRGSSPLESLRGRIEQDLEDLRGALSEHSNCQGAASSLEPMRERLAAALAPFETLLECAALVPGMHEPPQPPESLERIQRKLDTVTRLLDGIERLNHSDFRLHETRQLLEQCRALAQRQRESGRGLANTCLRRIEALAGLANLEELYADFETAVQRLTLHDGLDDIRSYSRLKGLAQRMLACIDEAKPAGDEQSLLLAANCCEHLRRIGESPCAEADAPSLQTLIEYLDVTQAADQEADVCLKRLRAIQPLRPVTGSESEVLQAWLAALPNNAPSTKRQRMRWERYLRNIALRENLQPVRNRLPDWVVLQLDAKSGTAEGSGVSSPP